MDTRTAQDLTNLTCQFYAHVHDSFSQTRQAPWVGWERVADACHVQARDRLDVLDLACGNLRFERFLAGKVTEIRAWCVDNCDELVGGCAEATIHYQHADLTRDLWHVEAPACDLCVCFGFMHHLPLASQRQDVLRCLVDHARPGGCIAVSFWQFEHDRRIMGKARPLPTRGDYLLGWQDTQGVARYCHSFLEQEIDELVACVGARAQEVARFSADGKRGDLNRYLVLRTQGAVDRDDAAWAETPRGARPHQTDHADHRRNS